MRDGSAIDAAHSVLCGLTLPELQRAPLTFELTPEQKKLSIHQIRPAAAMLKELARGWTPERAEEFWLKDQAEAAVREKEKAASGAASEKGMQHYLYIPRKADAEEAGELLRRRGFSVEVRESRADENWLILATNAPPKSGEQMGELRDELESLAAQFGGEYDGWEAPLGIAFQGTENSLVRHRHGGRVNGGRCRRAGARFVAAKRLERFVLKRPAPGQHFVKDVELSRRQGLRLDRSWGNSRLEPGPLIE